MNARWNPTDETTLIFKECFVFAKAVKFKHETPYFIWHYVVYFSGIARWQPQTHCYRFNGSWAVSAGHVTVFNSAALQHITFYTKPWVNISVKVHSGTFPLQKKKRNTKSSAGFMGTLLWKGKTKKNLTPSWIHLLCSWIYWSHTGIYLRCWTHAAFKRNGLKTHCAWGSILKKQFEPK